MNDENQIIHELKQNTNKIEQYTPDEQVWDRINNEVFTQRGKKNHRPFLSYGLAASVAIICAVPIVLNINYKNNDTNIAMLIKQSQQLELQLKESSNPKSISSALKWRLTVTESKLNSPYNDDEKLTLWRERVDVLTDVVIASNKKVEFI